MELQTFLKEHQEELDLYTNAITKAHGKHHPEVFEVKNLYHNIQQHVTNQQSYKAEFQELDRITHHFAIPDDVCPTFEKTYRLLEKAFQLAQA
ncbi:iron-sulfur cluster repair di-iron protein, ric [Streptococcus sp. ZJ151]|uniref:iron-sulfur cluster repair di-iron protein, ric n=1 Tax=Streptococcus jiangjianxini TaxID=3161189 RepID=UPI0032EBACB8